MQEYIESHRIISTAAATSRDPESTHTTKLNVAVDRIEAQTSEVVMHKKWGMSGNVTLF